MAGLNWQRLSVLACAVALSPVTELLAQDGSTGIVRISDRGGVKNVNHTKGEYNAPPAAMMGGHVHGGYAGDSCPECYGGGKVKSGSFSERYCTHSPDHGFSVPGKWPIHRRGVQYTNYYPHTWAGTEGPAGDIPAYPMVYMPTDTTQLGFYHQHVPFWQPQPNPLPRRPIPAQWHNYAPTVYASDWGNSMVKGGYGMGANCPVATDGTVIQSTPTPIQAPAQPAPAAANPEPPKPLPPAPEGGV